MRGLNWWTTLLSPEIAEDDQDTAVNLSEAKIRRWLRLFTSARIARSLAFLENGSGSDEFKTLWHSCSPAEQLTLIHVDRKDSQIVITVAS